MKNHIWIFSGVNNYRGNENYIYLRSNIYLNFVHISRGWTCIDAVNLSINEANKVFRVFLKCSSNKIFENLKMMTFLHSVDENHFFWNGALIRSLIYTNPDQKKSFSWSLWPFNCLHLMIKNHIVCMLF